jgi:LuxR family transcriptional regulator, maltose regulon positive regulatory protein
MALLRAYAWLEDFPAVEREAVAALALTEPVKLVLVPGAQALAWFESGHLAKAADAAAAADKDATRLGFSQHVFALDCLRAQAGLALERRDFDTAERLTERAISISERRWPALEFQALLDRAAIWPPADRSMRRWPLSRPRQAGPGRDQVAAARPGR